jgi:pentatricopeptide repeat protein
VARRTVVALTTSLCLLLAAAAQRVPWLAERVAQTEIVRSIGLGRLGGLGGAAGASVASPFAAVRAPSWSGTDALVTQLQDLLKTRPDDALSPARYAQLGSLYLQKARETGDPAYYAKADGVLAQSLARDPDNVLACVGMGGLALARHDFAGAIPWAEKVLARTPNSYVAYGILADAYTELGRYDEAVDALQKMVDLRPDQTSLSRVSYARELHGDLPNAIGAMQAAVDSGAPRAEGTNWSRVQLGNLYFNSGDLEQAEFQYKASLYFLPDYVHGIAGLAKVAAARGDLKGAADLYTRALAIMPWPQYAIELGDVYHAMGRPDDAAQQDALVRVIAQLQRAGGVDVDLEMALFEADHSTGPAALAAAVQEARAQYERRPSVHAADVLAWTLYRAGSPAEALPYAREALRLGTHDPLMLYHAAAIAAAAGQAQEASGYVAAALDLQPVFSVRYAPEARQLASQLGKVAG